MQLLTQGLARRHTVATKIKPASLRLHSILTATLWKLARPAPATVLMGQWLMQASRQCSC